MPVRVAVIGTAYGGNVQLPGFRRVPEVEVVAVASARQARAREVAARFGIANAYDDYRAMLDEVEIDLVSVASPPYLHYPMVIEALQRGKHVLCEKPFALNFGQAREMLEAAERAQVVHALGHEFRYYPARLAFKQCLEQGYLGEPRQVRVAWGNSQRARAEAPSFNWWSERDKGGGILGAIGSHYLDSLRWWFGDVRALTAALDVAVARRALADGSGWGEVTSDDTASLLFHLSSGVQGTLNLSAAAGPRGERVEALGSQGTLVIENDEHLLGSRDGGPLTELPLPAPSFPTLSGEHRSVGAFAELAQRMVARILGQPGADFPTFHEGTAVQAILDGAHRAAEERCWVEPGRI